MKEKRYFEWIAGDEIGEVVILESITEMDGEVFYNFDSGDTCNLRYISKKTELKGDLKEKFMVEVDSPSNVWTVEKIEPKVYSDKSMSESVEIPTLNDIMQGNGNGSEIDSNVGKDILVAPKRKQRFRELPDPKDWKPIEESVQSGVAFNVVDKSVPAESITLQNDAPSVIEQRQENAETRAAIDQTRIPEHMPDPIIHDPVYVMVSKSKKHQTDIPITLTMDLPSKSLYKIISDEFENGGEKFIECVVDGIDVRSIVESLKTALKDAYEKDDHENCE